jgi:hypothetical protein
MGMMSGGTSANRVSSAAVYVMTFVLGVAQGVVGSFQYSQSPAPLIAITLVVIIFVTCLLGGWGTMTVGGALAPGAGWILASFILSMGTHAGSVIITNTPAGKWFLYGGSLAVLAAVACTFALWLRAKTAQLQPPR